MSALVLQKAEISCKDCVEFTQSFTENKNCLIFIDPPYVREFGSACNTYSIRQPNECKQTIKGLPPFNIDNIKALFSVASQANGKVLITHSYEHEVLLAARCTGLDYLFSYANKANGSAKCGYETAVLSKNIFEKDCARFDKTNSAPVSSPYIDNALSRRMKRSKKYIQSNPNCNNKAKDVADACANQADHKREAE